MLWQTRQSQGKEYHVYIKESKLGGCKQRNSIRTTIRDINAYRKRQQRAWPLCLPCKQAATATDYLTCHMQKLASVFSRQHQWRR